MMRDISSEIHFWLCIFLFFFRYTKLVVGIFTFVFYRAVPVTTRSIYGSTDATVVVPTTFKDPGKLVRTLRSIQNCRPAKTLVVTASAHTAEVLELCSKFVIDNVQVFGVDKLSKRRQIVKALPHVETGVVVFADDDVIWPTHCLRNLLAIFDDDMVGAGGPCQRVTRPASPSFWTFLGICYLERRVWNNITTQAIDGSISTLSGRTSAYRTELLKTPEFYNYFLNDSFLGKTLDSDDDKCLTRHIFRNGYKIKLQRSVTIETSMEANFTYLAQCNRWARAHWRGNFTVMVQETYWASLRHIWGLYAIYISQFLTPTIVFDMVLLKLYAGSLSDMGESKWKLYVLAAWILVGKLIRLVPYFYQYPQDMVFIPAVILFGWFHGLLNVYALSTLSVTKWGSQAIEKLEQPGRILDDTSGLFASEIDHAALRLPSTGFGSSKSSGSSTPHEKEQ